MEDKFEQQIADQVSGFQLAPNAQVWMGVELELDKEKSKKRGFYWFIPIGLLGVGLAGWYLFTATHTPQIPNSETQQKNVKKDLFNHSIPAKDSNAIVNQSNPLKGSIEKAKSNSLTATSFPKASAQVVHHELSQPNHQNQGLKEVSQKQNSEIEQKNNALLIQQSQEQQKMQTTITSSTTTISTIDSSQAFKEATSATKRDEVIIQEKPRTKDSIASFVSTKSSLTKKPIKTSWRFQVALGSTRLSETNLIGNSTAADRAAFTNNSSVVTSGFPTITNSTASNKGFHAELGLSKNWLLSKRWELEVGLSYRYLQNQQLTGSKKDSSYLISSQVSTKNQPYSLSSYYLPGSQNSLINRAHWLMLPIQIHFNLNPSSKLNWLLYGGTNLSWNFASNWLLVDQVNNILYKARPLTNLIGIHAQFGIEIRNQKSKSLSLGWEKSINGMSKLIQSKQYWNQLQIEYSQPIYLKKSYKK